MTPTSRVTLGLIGHPVGHSQSPALFKQILARDGRADMLYEAFDLSDVEGFPAFVEDHPNLLGLNVTVPHKKNILPMLSALSPEAKALGAVNTLVRTPSGWKGHNTDVWGFQRSIQPFLMNRHERALVVGTGGSAAAVHHVLRTLGIETLSVSRSGDSANDTRAFGRPSIGYHELGANLLRHHLLVVQCTPVGMAPNTGEKINFPVDLLTPNHLIMVLIYNPSETLLLRLAKAQGAATLNGADMLRLQAEKAWEIWQEAGV